MLAVVQWWISADDMSLCESTVETSSFSSNLIFLFRSHFGWCSWWTNSVIFTITRVIFGPMNNIFHHLKCDAHYHSRFCKLCNKWFVVTCCCSLLVHFEIDFRIYISIVVLLFRTGKILDCWTGNRCSRQHWLILVLFLTRLTSASTVTFERINSWLNFDRKFDVWRSSCRSTHYRPFVGDLFVLWSNSPHTDVNKSKIQFLVQWYYIYSVIRRRIFHSLGKWISFSPFYFYTITLLFRW